MGMGGPGTTTPVEEGGVERGGGGGGEAAPLAEGDGLHTNPGQTETTDEFLSSDVGATSKGADTDEYKPTTIG
jgi:hypothetical protein